MTQKKSEHPPDADYVVERRKGTRIDNAPPDLYDPNEPRLGRRESEPHAAEVTYLHDVLTTNFPSGRAVWDLHHYFLGTKGVLKGEKIDIQFDVSFFKDFKISHTLSSYKARDHEGRIPDFAFNVLSKSTWRNDLSENVDKCKNLSIPVYAVFSPYKVTSRLYHPPFLRVFILQDNETYEEKELRAITLEEGGAIIEKNIINLHDKLPFSLGLMRLKQLHEGKQSLYRLILINPSTLEVFPIRLEKKDKTIEEKDKTIDEKDQTIERLKAQLKLK